MGERTRRRGERARSSAESVSRGVEITRISSRCVAASGGAVVERVIGIDLETRWDEEVEDLAGRWIDRVGNNLLPRRAGSEAAEFGDRRRRERANVGNWWTAAR